MPERTEMPKRSYSAMVVGTQHYNTIFNAAVNGFGKKEALRGYVAKAYGIDFRLRFDFFRSCTSGWSAAQDSPHDIYFIDAAYDNPVRSPSSLQSQIAVLGLSRTLSESIRELYPSATIVGVSAMGQFFTKENVHRYDIAVDLYDINSTERLTSMLVRLGFIPKTEEQKTTEAIECAQEDVDEFVDKLMKDPVARRALQKEGY